MSGNEMAPSSLSHAEVAAMKRAIYAAAFVAEFRQIGDRYGNDRAIDDVPRIHEEAEAVADIWEEYAG